MVRQIAIFLENQEGKASACCRVLKEVGVNLLALSIADTKDFGILRILTDNNEKAVSALRGAGFLCSVVDLVGLEVSDKPGALSDLLISLGENNINVEYMYSYAEADGHAKIVFKTSAVEKALEVLTAAGAKLL